MNRGSQTLDRQPGALPEIRVSEDSITFVMAPPRANAGKRLRLRCDASGEVWLSLQPQESD